MRGESALVALVACWCAAEATLVCSNTTFCEMVTCERVDAGRCAGEVRPNATMWVPIAQNTMVGDAKEQDILGNVVLGLCASIISAQK
ncbi:Protein of unknown function [Gryllus bimaculatus]|nr:Protein of unknown function [Gryllus bimaculatus]